MFVKSYSIALSLMSAIVVATLGCDGPANEYDAVVTGTVTVDGELANAGTVTFHPMGKGRLAIGRIHSDGSYSLRTGQGDLSKLDGGTVMSGDYRVTVSVSAPPPKDSALAEGGPPIAGPSLIASKYRQRDTTDLRFTVKPGPQVIVLNLDRAEPEPLAEEEGDTEKAEGTEDAANGVEDDSAPGDVETPSDAADDSNEATAPGEPAENVEAQAP